MKLLIYICFLTDDNNDCLSPTITRINKSKHKQDQPSTSYSSLQYEERAESGKGIESLMR